MENLQLKKDIYQESKLELTVNELLLQFFCSAPEEFDFIHEKVSFIRSYSDIHVCIIVIEIKHNNSTVPFESVGASIIKMSPYENLYQPLLT